MRTTQTKMKLLAKASSVVAPQVVALRRGATPAIILLRAFGKNVVRSLRERTGTRGASALQSFLPAALRSKMKRKRTANYAG